MARTARGFTLLELLVAMAISAIVLTSVVLVGNSQVRAYAQGARQRVAQAQGRGALLYLEEQVARAGFGVEPAFAFDFNRYLGGPCPAEMAPCTARDSVGNSDELVFYARNPSYWVPGDGNAADPSGNAWPITATSATSVTVRARKGDVFRMGQVVLEVCRGATFYAYATVAKNLQVAAAGSVDVELQPAVATDPFNRPDLAVPPATGASCFSGGLARLFLIDRFRFHVRPETVDGNVIPYLVLDQGVDRNLDGAVNADDELLVAEGVESLQVGYVMANSSLPTPVLGSANAIKPAVAPDGDIRYAPATAGSSTTPDELTLTAFPGAAPAFGESVYAPSSWVGLTVGPPPSPQRLTDHQANIVGVRIALVTRSAATDLQSPGDTFRPLNQTSDPAWVTARQIDGRDGYQRALFTSTVLLPDMTVGGLTYF
ncbi:MAG TPA: prepilin-type N-terminal cleavage/methylation domain-containing protein [Anaeromyxobacteraceae bacterium]|nr:prepilin-type N-terminal cleavage/methylation domain-containing protein [Anaeromyxobacteraceae bacterium]